LNHNSSPLMAMLLMKSRLDQFPDLQANCL
jgi:hypothetical protein